MLVYKIKPKPWTNIAGKTQTSENKYYLRKFRLRNFRYTNIRLKFHTRSHQFGKFLQAFCWECWWFSLSSWLFVMTATSLACSRYGPLGSYMAMGHIGRLYGLSTWDGTSSCELATRAVHQSWWTAASCANCSVCSGPSTRARALLTSWIVLISVGPSPFELGSDVGQSIL